MRQRMPFFFPDNSADEPITAEEILFDKLDKLYSQYEVDEKALLQEYKSANQKYPIGFEFPYKGETAKINGCFVELQEPDFVNILERFVYICYSCYVPSICDQPIQTPSGSMVVGDRKNIGLRVLQIEIDRILEVKSNA